MKIEKEIIIEEEIIPEHTIKKIIVQCDFCENEAGQYCETCGRDICSDHYIADYRDSDYPDKYCLKCYDLFEKKYKKDFEEIEKDYAKRIEDLTNKIIKESLGDNDEKTI